MKIGVIDSGIGGLTLLKHIYDCKLFSEIIYYSDRANLPYGEKSASDINLLTSNLLYKLSKYNLDYIYIACNTISVNITKDMIKNIKIPIILINDNIVEVVKSRLGKKRKTLFIATTATINSNYYQDIFTSMGYDNISFENIPKLATMIEEKNSSKEIIEYISSYLHKYKDLDYLIIGCTHYSYITDIIKDNFSNIDIIDIESNFIEQFFFNKIKLTKEYDPKVQLYDTLDTKYIRDHGNKYLGINIE